MSPEGTAAAIVFAAVLVMVLCAIPSVVRRCR